MDKKVPTKTMVEIDSETKIMLKKICEMQGRTQIGYIKHLVKQELKALEGK